jgi:hypothetical protein
VTILVAEAWESILTARWSLGAFSRRYLLGAFAVFTLLSFATEIAGLSSMYRLKSAYERVLQIIESGPANVIVTDVWWVPQVTADLYYDKVFLLLKREADNDKLAAALERGKVTDLVTITADFPDFQPGGYIRLNPEKWKLVNQVTIPSWTQIVLRFYQASG